MLTLVIIRPGEDPEEHPCQGNLRDFERIANNLARTEPVGVRVNVIHNNKLHYTVSRRV